MASELHLTSYMDETGRPDDPNLEYLGTAWFFAPFGVWEVFEESEHLRKIMQMLFLQDDLRITSASYTKIPYVPLDYAQEVEKEPRPLEVIQAVLAYCYGAPQPYQDRPFLEYEHASLAVLSPGGVSVFMVRPEHSAVALLDSAPTLKPDHQHFVPGYSGVLNFKHYFWLAEGSRLYARLGSQPQREWLRSFYRPGARGRRIGIAGDSLVWIGKASHTGSGDSSGGHTIRLSIHGVERGTAVQHPNHLRGTARSSILGRKP